VEWLFLFYIYSILGWVWESIYMSFVEKKLLNRGFLYGPWIPLYGAGATVALFSTMPFREHMWLVFVVGMIASTILEEVTGRVMDILFDVRYWTYEGYPGNIDDIICVPASILWGCFSLFAMYVLNLPFDYLLGHMNLLLIHRIVLIVTIFFVVDVTLSVKDALDFKVLLLKMSNGKDELLRLKKRLDVMIAFYDDKHQYIARMKESIGSRKDTFMDAVYSVRIRLEIMDEIRHNRNLSETELESERLRELLEIHSKFKEQETTVQFYQIPFRRHVKRLLYSNPKARLLKLGASIKDMTGSVISHLPGRDDSSQE
jgi:uncharacterized membrane protein